ncbi:hypothetical protein COU60_03600 [Candidatus Pacearchaeota archaeon CG10_big_fil_rev_8_21_14_0_10_34_76]|nr:MAG: hypothetical protein COU60_03600 [Candidatus Pacearchaeota archaeon CG10_big_fil_rev_8_21_14_0_10_34_76]
MEVRNERGRTKEEWNKRYIGSLRRGWMIGGIGALTFVGATTYDLCFKPGSPSISFQSSNETNSVESTRGSESDLETPNYNGIQLEMSPGDVVKYGVGGMEIFLGSIGLALVSHQITKRRIGSDIWDYSGRAQNHS